MYISFLEDPFKRIMDMLQWILDESTYEFENKWVHEDINDIICQQKFYWLFPF